MLRKLNLQALGDPRNFWPITTSLIIHALFLVLVTMPRAPKVPEFITIDMNALPSFGPPAGGGSSAAGSALPAAAPPPAAQSKAVQKAPEMVDPTVRGRVAKPVEQVSSASASAVSSAAVTAGGVPGGVVGGVPGGVVGGVVGGVPGGSGGGPGGPGVGNGPINGSFGAANGPAFTNMVRPAYPRIARKLGREGVVKLRLMIDEKGRLLSVNVLEKAGHGFDEAAVNAVKASSFRPAKLHGKPVACRALWKVKFALAD